MSKDPITAHPDYADGYWEAMEGEPLFADASEEYRAGWQAAWRAKTILTGGGMIEVAPGEFSMALSLTREPQPKDTK